MSDYDSFISSSPVSPSPPILPPIPRVASRHESHRPESEDLDAVSRAAASTVYKEDGQVLSLTPPSSTNPLSPNIAGKEERQRVEYLAALRRPSAPQESYIRDRPKVDLRPHTSLGNEMRYHSETQLAQSPSPRPGTSNTFHGESVQYVAPSKPSQLPTSNSNYMRSNKTKLNILNPMSLLNKRRTSQTPPQPPSETHNSNRTIPVPGMRLPDDYDPRIRGKMVHDFSAPRPKRDTRHNGGSAPFQEPHRQQGHQRRDSSNAYEQTHWTDRNRQSGQSASPGADEDGPANMERAHTPIFKEHFGDDVEPWRSDQGLLIKQPATIYMSHLSVPDPGHDPSSLPAFARNLPIDIATTLKCAPTRAPPPPPPITPSKQPLPAVEETSIPVPFSNHSLTLPSPPISPPKNRSRATSNTDPNFQSAGLPRHLPSNASRFSFDLAGVGSAAQEKLLEEKHRQKAAQDARKKVTSSPSDGNEDDGDESDFDYMDDDGLEERIPGVNTDADEEETARALGNFVFASAVLNSPTSPESTALTSITTPRNSGGQSIGFAPSKESLDLWPQRHLDVSQHSLEDQRNQYFASHHELAVSATSIPEDRPLSTPLIHNSNDPSRPPPSGAVNDDDDDDDMYFDDGMIDNLDEEDGQAFDESVFDDETSRVYSIPIRDLKYLAAEPETHEPEDIRQPFDRSQLTALDTSIDTTSLGLRCFPDNIAQPPSSTDHQHPGPSSYDHTAGLTQDNLAAYHDALAFAANQAALDGRFIRKPSVDDSLQSPPDHNTFLGINTDTSGVSREAVYLPQDKHHGDTSDSEFDFDDTLEDDPIIAAANAEALENDDEGFYGQEFGFFAHASGEAEYANGGYFGTRGADGIGRSHSGRVNFQEPSLTPITERSEWSNRTSTISLAMYGLPHPSQAQNVSSPGLAQLADMMQHEDDNMSLSALLKLRRGAWGGSNNSLRSSTGSQQSGSPLTHFPPGPLGPVGASYLVASGSNHSLPSAASPSSDSPPASPTVTSHYTPSSPAPTQAQAQAQAPSQSLERLLTTTVGVQSGAGGFGAGRSKGAGAGRAGHSRNSSAASESVSYVHERDEGGPGRWWLETRRVEEGGEGVVVGRRVVEGGRI